MWMSNCILFLDIRLAKEGLKCLPIGLMVCRKMERLAAIDVLFPVRFVGAYASGHDQGSLRLSNNPLIALIGDVVCERTITDHIESLQELAGGPD